MLRTTSKDEPQLSKGQRCLPLCWLNSEGKGGSTASPFCNLCPDSMLIRSTTTERQFGVSPKSGELNCPGSIISRRPYTSHLNLWIP